MQNVVPIWVTVNNRVPMGAGAESRKGMVGNIRVLLVIEGRRHEYL